jgi:uncharacterized protein
MDAWQQLGVAIAMVFVIEGMVPFLAPGRWRRLVATMADLDDRTMRTMGLVSMLVGLALLYLIR